MLSGIFEMNTSLMALGDFVTCIHSSLTWLRDVIETKKIIHREQEILIK